MGHKQFLLSDDNLSGKSVNFGSKKKSRKEISLNTTLEQGRDSSSVAEDLEKDEKSDAAGTSDTENTVNQAKGLLMYILNTAFRHHHTFPV